MHSYAEYNSKEIECNGPEGFEFEKAVKAEMEIGELYSGVYIIFPRCQKETRECKCSEVKGKDITCKFRKVKTEDLKEMFFPNENVFGLPPQK